MDWEDTSANYTSWADHKYPDEVFIRGDSNI